MKDQSWNLHGWKSKSFFLDCKKLGQFRTAVIWLVFFFLTFIFVNHSYDHGTEDGLTT